MLLHAGEDAGIQCDSGGGNCSGIGNLYAGLWAADQCDCECACVWFTGTEHVRARSTWDFGGVPEMPEDESSWREILFRLRDCALIFGPNPAHEKKYPFDLLLPK